MRRARRMCTSPGRETKIAAAWAANATSGRAKVAMYTINTANKRTVGVDGVAHLGVRRFSLDAQLVQRNREGYVSPRNIMLEVETAGHVTYVSGEVKRDRASP